MTRRAWRKNRPKLNVGDTRLEGRVVEWFPRRLFGFIQPVNGAARIYFHYIDVPHHRQKCVGKDRKVFFDVAQGKEGKLKAIVR